MLIFFSFLSFSIDFVIWPFSAHKKHQKKSFMGDHAMRRSKIKDFHLSFRTLCFSLVYLHEDLWERSFEKESYNTV